MPSFSHFWTHNWQNRGDRVALYTLAGLPISLLFAIVKIGLGIYNWSIWLVFFGCFYLILVGNRAWLLYRYTRIRLHVTSAPERLQREQTELRTGGWLLALLGAVFAGICLFMYLHGHNQHFNTITAITVACIGFTKLITAIIGLARSRRHHSPLLVLLKAFSLTDGLVAIVLTQFTLLTFRHSANANTSTGLFGFVIGAVLTIIGIVLAVRTSQRVKDDVR